MTFLKDREGRLSHHKRSGWFSPWQAAWINLRAMFVYGSGFFVYKPGLVLMMLGLLLTVPLSFGNIQLGGVGLSLNWQFLGVALLTVGAQAFFLGCIARVLFDYTGRQKRRWLRVFPYTRTVLLSVRHSSLLGIALCDSARCDLHRQRACARAVGRLAEPSRRHRRCARDSRRPALRLHAAAARRRRRHDARPSLDAPKQLARWLPLTSSTTAGSRASPRTRSPRGSPCRCFAARRCARARTRWRSRSRRTHRGRPTRSSAASTKRSGKTRSSTSGAATSSGASSASFATCRARSSRSASGAAARASLMADARRLHLDSTSRCTSATRGRASSRPVTSTRTTATASTTTPRGKPSRHWPLRSALTNVELLQGVFPDETADRIADSRFRLCHCDVDVYRSAKDVFDWVWPRLAPGGVVVFDDYGFPACPGVTKFVDEQRLLGDRTRHPQPQRPWHRRQALTRSERSGAYGQHRRPDPGRPLRRLAVGGGPFGQHVPELHRQGDRRLRLRLRRTVRPLGPRRGGPCHARRRRARAGSEGRIAGSPRSRATLPDALRADRATTRSTSCSASPCSSTSGIRPRLLRELRRVAAPGGVCLVNVPSWRGQAVPRALRVPARPQPGRGDGRPQDLLRPARPLAAADRGRLSAERHRVLQAQVRPQHLRGLQGCRR